MLVLILALLLPTQQELRPVRFRADSPNTSSDYVLSVIEELGVRLPAERLATIKGVQKSRAKRSIDGQPSRTGWIWYLDSRSQAQRARYEIAERRDRLDQMIEQRLSDTGEVSFIGPNRIRISNRTVRTDSVELKLPDAFLVYADGMCLHSGSSSLHSVNFSRVIAWEKNSTGKHSSSFFDM